MPGTSRLQQQIAFLTEIDKLKQVLRRTWLLDQSRYENDAEHSWHIAVAAMLFLEYADDPKVDVLGWTTPSRRTWSSSATDPWATVPRCWDRMPRI